MINQILTILIITLIVTGYLIILFTYLTNKNKTTNNKSASNIVLDLLNNDSTINLIESKESIFSKYNIKRKMVKLSSNTYDNNSCFSQAMATLLSGYSLTNNKYLNILGKIFNELKIVTFSPLIVILINIFATNIADSKIAIIILIVIGIYQYMLNDINSNAISTVTSNDTKINQILTILMKVNTLFFITTLITIIKLIIIIFRI